MILTIFDWSVILALSASAVMSSKWEMTTYSPLQTGREGAEFAVGGEAVGIDDGLSGPRAIDGAAEGDIEVSSDDTFVGTIHGARVLSYRKRALCCNMED